MYDPTIHPKTLGRHLQSKDFFDHPYLLDPVQKHAVLDQAASYGLAGFPPASLTRNRLRGKTIYGFSDISEALVIRHITSNIRRVTAVKQDDRAFIVSCIKTLVSDGTPFSVYKFDVASFYESVDVSAIADRLATDIAFSGQSVRALSSFLSRLAADGIKGLPRGLSLSATLAEYLMRHFDHQVKNLDGVWYYARFVDDILIITDGRENALHFANQVSAFLPDGLQFNQKSRHIPFAKYQKGNPPDSEGKFDFLGYEFDVSKSFQNANNKIVRLARVDLSVSKVKKIKTRVAKSLQRYKVDQRFLDLRDRIRILSGNVVYIDYKSGMRRASGLPFSYPLLDNNTSAGLKELDRFLRIAITAPHAKNRLFPSGLSQVQRKELAGLTFSDGFAERRFFHVHNVRLANLTMAWAYV